MMLLKFSLILVSIAALKMQRKVRPERIQNTDYNHYESNSEKWLEEPYRAFAKHSFAYLDKCLQDRFSSLTINFYHLRPAWKLPNGLSEQHSCQGFVFFNFQCST